MEFLNRQRAYFGRIDLQEDIMKKLLNIFFLILNFLLLSAPVYGTTPDYLSRYKADYDLYDLGSVTGGTSFAYSVSNAMEVAGYTANGSGQKAFVYSGGVMQNIGVATTLNSKAMAINDSGQVAGYVSNGHAEAYLYQNGTTQFLGNLGGNSYAFGLNSWGQVVGSSKTKNGDTHGFLYDGTSMRDIGTLGGNFCIANDISDLGGVVGTSTTGSGDDHAFLYSAGTGYMKDIGTLGGSNSYGNAINLYGQAVGASDTISDDSHAFFYNGDTMLDLGTLGGSESAANGINDLGFVVGYAETADSEIHAFIYHEKAFWYDNVTMVDLNDFIPDGSDWGCLTAAYDVNEWGQIVGIGTTKDGEIHAFLLNPTDVQLSQVPVPGTFILFSSCVLLLGTLKRRKA